MNVMDGAVPKCMVILTDHHLDVITTNHHPHIIHHLIVNILIIAIDFLGLDKDVQLTVIPGIEEVFNNQQPEIKVAVDSEIAVTVDPEIAVKAEIDNIEMTVEIANKVTIEVVMIVMNGMTVVVPVTIEIDLIAEAGTDQNNHQQPVVTLLTEIDPILDHQKFDEALVQPPVHLSVQQQETSLEEEFPDQVSISLTQRNGTNGLENIHQ